jgi:phosphoribosyl 1,2-cyclic phosphodiesterase
MSETARGGARGLGSILERRATMPSETAFRITFWGVTGSFPRPMTAADLRQTIDADFGGEPLTYGGDTTCVQIEAGDRQLIVDAGTGMQRLSQSLSAKLAAGTSLQGAIFLTHPHLDHVCSLPFFEPLYDAASDFTLYAAPRTLHALEKLGRPEEDLAGVFLPQTLAQMPGLKHAHAIEAGTAIEYGDVRVSTFALNHPGGCLAYRFERRGKSVVIATDHEQPQSPDRPHAEFARGADVLYLDAQYLRAEYDGQVGVAGELPQSRTGWGHTPLEDCFPTAAAANAKRLLLGHHDPRRNDAALREIAKKVRDMPTPCEATLAYQGLSIEL